MAGREQSRRLLKCVDDSFLAHAIEELTTIGAQLHLSSCIGSGWDGVNFLHSSSYSAVF